MIIMAIDLGTVRTGIAVCDKSETFAFPREVIKQPERKLLFEEIKKIAEREKAELIVMGLPKNMNGSEGFKADGCREAAEEIAKLTGLSVELWDERCTTISAHTALRENGVMGKKRKTIVDSVAATIILESFLQKRKNEKTV